MQDWIPPPILANTTLSCYTLLATLIVVGGLPISLEIILFVTKIMCFQSSPVVVGERKTISHDQISILLS